MGQERYRRIKDLCQRALELEPSARQEFLRRECGDDRHLLLEVQRLLEFDDSRADDLTLVDVPELRDLSGTTLGPYEIMQPLGEGGMGVVYLAAQSAPLRRKVAVKVIKVGMDTREVIARFESERQALALMDHPNIAQVYDAGATESGRPYFAMEYIPGVSLTRYCREHDLGLRQRLDLFLDVCRGVEHAHQKGVIHRDLKPSNILVTESAGRPVPKIIDFGVAKATSAHLSARTFFTQLGRVVGTPEYMSPEQANPESEDIDTRSDVFSLGVVLYELLTDMLPISRQELLRAGYDRIGSLVKELTPAKPSTRLSTSTRESARGDGSVSASVTPTWVRQIRGDLDWITMKALERERVRRYADVGDLADDIERHLQHQAVRAGPPSRIYRVRKFVRRNRTSVGGAVVLGVALVAFGVWQAVQSRIIAQQRNEAIASQRLALAESHLATDPTVSVAFALASLEISDQRQTRNVVRLAYTRGPLRNELPRWDGHGNPLSCDASPDGRFCAASWSHTSPAKIGIYDLDDYSLRVIDSTSDGCFTCLMITSDSRHVVANDEYWDAGLHVWRVSDGEHLWFRDDFIAHDSVGLHRPDDPNIVVISGSSVGEKAVWYEFDIVDGDVNRLGRSQGVQSRAGAMYHPAIDASMTRVLEYRESTVLLTDVADLDTERTTIVGEHEFPVAAVAMTDDGTRALSIDLEGRTKVWDLAASPPRLMREFIQQPGMYHAKFSADGERFFTGEIDRPVHLYDVDDRPPRLARLLLDRSHWTHEGSFLPDGSLVTSRNAVDTGPIAIWSAESPLAWSFDADGRIERGHDCQLSPDRRWLVEWSRDGRIHATPLVRGDDVPRGLLGETDGWFPGTLARYVLDETNRFFVYNNAFRSSGVIDLATGVSRPVPGFATDLLPIAISPRGRFVCYYDLEGPPLLRIVDLEQSVVTRTIPIRGATWQHTSFAGDRAFLLLWDDALVRHDFTTSPTSVDTLWRGDAGAGGRILAGGEELVVRDTDLVVTLIDLQGGREIALGMTPAGRTWPTAFAHERSLGLVAVGGWWETIEVFSTRTGEQWHLPIGTGKRSRTGSVGFDALGRWLITDLQTRVVAWNLPLDPVFTDLPTEAMLARVRGLTNLRVRPDAEKSSGFAIDNATALASESMAE